MIHMQQQQNHDAIMEATGVSSSTRVRWRSPALYIFAGVAGMLGFIGLASVALLCLWWKMSSAPTNAAAVAVAAPRDYNNRVTGSTAVAAASAEESSEKNEDTVVCCVGDAGPHKVLIIMPGQQQPTFVGSQLSHHTSAPCQ